MCESVCACVFLYLAGGAVRRRAARELEAVRRAPLAVARVRRRRAARARAREAAHAGLLALRLPAVYLAQLECTHVVKKLSYVSDQRSNTTRCDALR